MWWRSGPSRKPRWAAAALVASVAVGVFSGCATIPPPRAAWNLATPAPKPNADRSAFNLRVYDNVWAWVESRYYDPHFNGVDWQAARERHRQAAAAARDDAGLYAAINELLRELNDPHTRAQSAADFTRTFWQRSVLLGWRSVAVPNATDGRRRITEVFAGGGAAEAGVRVGWIVLTCDGRPAAEFIAASILRPDQKIQCEFLDEHDAPRRLTVTAREVKVPTFRTFHEVADGVYLVRFDRFDLVSAHWVREEVKAHANAKGLIFDLRGNPGGNLFALSSILGDVFPHAIDTGQLVHRGHEAIWHRLIPQWGGARYAGPLAVLVSRGSASAAEVFAELVQENRRGPVIGEKTRGALLTVVFWPLPGGGKLWLSVYDYHSPKGVRVESRGVLPDIEVPLPATAAADLKDDPWVQKAVRSITGKNTL